MNKQLIHINKKISPDMVRREKVDGADAIVIRSATLPDNVVMNGGLYPAEEIAASYQGLERKLAPMGHPMKDGKFISANDPYAVHNYDVGAYVANVTRENGRVFHDTVINIEAAQRTSNGRKLLEAIANMEETGEPIHTSTGIYLKRKELDQPMTNAAGDTYTWVASNMVFDHNAILINEEGAATPEQGVGLAVNSQGEEMEVMTVNEDDEYLTDEVPVEEKLEWLRDALRDAIALKEPEAEHVYVVHCGIYNRKVVYETLFTDKTTKTFAREYGMIDGLPVLGDQRTEVERKTLWKIVKDSMSFIKNMAFAQNIDTAYNDSVMTTNSTEESDMALTPEEKAALVAEITDKVTVNVTQAVTSAVQPLTEDLAALKTNMQANENAERAPLIEKAKAKGVAEADAQAMSTNALKVMFGTPEQASATYVAGGEPQVNSDDYKTTMPNSKKEG